VRILAVCGSLQHKSANLALLERAAALAPETTEVVLFEGLRDLPLFNPELEQGVAPAPVEQWRRALSGSAAVLIASPEYGHSLPGALKNGIDWVIGSGELYRKVVAITTAVKDRSRGRLGLSALAQTLGAVDAAIVWDQPIVEGPTSDIDVAALLRALIDRIRRDETAGDPSTAY
jgi:chromate reductase